MSVASLERDLAQFLENTGYAVKFQHAHGYNWFYTYVFFDGKVIAEKAVCKSYPRAAKWSMRQVRSHQKAVRTLAGVLSA